jgi:hypothetical protein
MENTTNQQDEKGHDANIVLAVSGQPFHSIEEVIKTLDLAQCEIRAFYKRFNYQDSNVLRQIDSVHEALKAACANGGEAQGVSVDYRSKYEKAIKVIKRFDAGIITMYDL